MNNPCIEQVMYTNLLSFYVDLYDDLSWKYSIDKVKIKKIKK